MKKFLLLTLFLFATTFLSASHSRGKERMYEGAKMLVSGGTAVLFGPERVFLDSGCEYEYAHSSDISPHCVLNGHDTIVTNGVFWTGALMVVLGAAEMTPYLLEKSAKRIMRERKKKGVKIPAKHFT